MRISGNNAAITHVGGSYSDLGTTISGPTADLKLGITPFLNGQFTSNIVIDTSAVATDTSTTSFRTKAASRPHPRAQ